MKKLILVVFLFCCQVLPAQERLYRGSAPVINQLVHTKLAVRFDYEKAWMYGQAWITCQPHFYATDSLQLDARQMDIEKVFILYAGKELPVHFSYDGQLLNIRLNKSYTAKEKYTIHIIYTAKPDSKGLYFINRNGKIPNKPIQIWTDGETNFTSYWCPTIDQPNQKGSFEVAMTVPDQYLTLSNGVIVAQKKNPDNTRTDQWQMDLPLAPYLFFLGVGDFAVIKDHYKGIAVDYYVEKSYGKDARKIFGSTPEMMGLFSRLTGVPYPWPKYAQAVVRDFTSAAMENTSITVHGEAAQQDARELADWNRWENNIAHELFHQWFGDYVTCESWSNLALNESFASYGTYLWREYKYGRDKADEGLYDDMQAYLGRKRDHPRELVRFYYEDAEDMFDNVSYQKGGCILHMLRKIVGDSAFFTSLNRYLVTYQNKTAEVQQLRLAFEEVTGRDLNTFFNQWFYGSGHPVVEINYSYNDAKKTISVILEQKQAKPFSFPLKIDVYAGSVKTTFDVWASNTRDTFNLPCAAGFALVNVDAEKYMLWEKKDNKPLQSYIQQYRLGGNYNDRIESIKESMELLNDRTAVELVKTSLKDTFSGIRLFTLQKLFAVWDKLPADLKTTVEPILADLAADDNTALVRAKAIELLGTYHHSNYINLFSKATGDSSYSVAGAALNSLVLIDSSAAYAIAKKQIHTQIKRTLASSILSVMMLYGTAADFDDIYAVYEPMAVNGYKLSVTVPFINYLVRIHDISRFRKAVDNVVTVRDNLPQAYKSSINEALKKLADRKDLENEKEFSSFVRTRL